MAGFLIEVSTSYSLIKQHAKKSGNNILTQIQFHVDPFFKTSADILTHYRPAMPLGNRNIYFRGSLKFSIVTVRIISPLLKPEI